MPDTSMPPTSLAPPSRLSTPVSPSLRRVVALTSSSNLAVPLIGIFTAPMLARGLGVEGRGEVAAAMSPLLLIVTVATLGLPEAVVYLLARYPSMRWMVIRTALLWSAVVGALSTGVFLALIPVVSRNIPAASGLMKVAAACILPTLMLGVVRAAAIGLQMWRQVAFERVSNGLLRLIALSVLLAVGNLNVLTAVITLSAAPLIAGAVYLPGLLGRDDHHDVEVPPEPSRLRMQLRNFGMRAWVGSLAAILLGRLDQAIFTPLSTSHQLGIYAVAVAISDVTYLLVSAVGDGVIGVTSRTSDARSVARATRYTLLLALFSGVVIALTLPLWVTTMFGAGFDAAVGPTVLLLLSSVIGAPGIIAGVGLGAFNRPGLRSLGVLVAVPTNVIVLVLLAPGSGALGAAWAMVAANLALATVTIGLAARVLALPPTEFFVIRVSDLFDVAEHLKTMLRRPHPERPAPV